MAENSVNWLVKSTQKKYVRINLLLAEFIKIVRNEILHIQCTTHNAVILFYKLTGRFKSEHSL
jgi:hypothetical protein